MTTPTPCFPCYRPHNRRISVGFLALYFVIAATSESCAQSTITTCLPPQLPIVPSDAAMQHEFRDVLSEEFQTYFNLMGEYMSCLNDASHLAREEINQAITDYNALIKDIPR